MDGRIGEGGAAGGEAQSTRPPRGKAGRDAEPPTGGCWNRAGWASSGGRGRREQDTGMDG